MSKAALPGWKMTRAQHDLLLFTLWPAACEYQGWPSRDREAKRREVTAEVFRGPKSWKEINRTNEFDAIKSRLELLAGKISVDDDGERRRVLSRVGELIARFHEIEHVHYLEDLLSGPRFKIVPGLRTIADLSTNELKNLSITLTNRLASLEKKATAENAENAEAGTNPF